MMLSTSSIVKFVGRTLYSTTINYATPILRMAMSLAWSNLSVPAMCCCAVASLMIGLYLFYLGKWYAKVAIFVGGASYYVYLAWFVYENLPVFHWYFLVALCAWAVACNTAVDAATGWVWPAAKFVFNKVLSLVLTLLRAAAGKIRRGPAAGCEVSSNNGATAPSVSAAPAKAKKTKSKAKAKNPKAKKTKATANVSVEAQAVPAPVKDQEVVPAVPSNTSVTVVAVPTKALSAFAKAYGAVDAALRPVMEIVLTIVPILDVLGMALKLTSKAYQAVDSALDPVMEVVFTVVPIFDVLAEVLKLTGAVLSKASDAFEAVLNPVMEVVCTIVPIFDVLEVAIGAAAKLAVVLATALRKVATFLGMAAAFALKFVRDLIVTVVVAILKKIVEPVMWMWPILKFVFYTGPRYILSVVLSLVR